MNMHQPRRNAPPENKPPEDPAFIEAEQSLIGSIMMKNDLFYQVSSSVEPMHFYEPVHADIWEAISDLILKGRSANPGSVKMSMTGSDRMIGTATMASYLASLLNATVGYANVIDQAKGIREAFNRRRLIQLGREMISLGFQEGKPEVLAEKVTEAQTQAGNIVAGLEDRESFSGSSLIDGYLSMISKDPAQKARHGVPIPHMELRAVLSEPQFEAQNLYGMLSSSGEGKSSLTMQLLYHAAVNGHPTLFFSYDQTGPQCVAQIVAQHTGLEQRRQKSGDLTPKDFDKAAEFASGIAGLPFEVVDCDSSRDNPTRLATIARRFLKKHGNGKTPFFVFDHMSAIPNEWEDRGADEGTKALKKGQALKSIAKTLNGVCLVLQQRSGSGMKRFNPRPTAQDLYGGEAARQPFDAIFFLFRAEEHMNRQMDTAKDEKERTEITARFASIFPKDIGIVGTAEVGGLKVRFGRNGVKRYMNFIPEYTRYESRYVEAGLDQVELL